MSPGQDHPASLSADRLAAECTTRFTRRSGPGGQNRNKVETAVVLLHLPSGIVAEANERRSQADNLRMALSRLRLKLALEIRRPVEPGDLPSPLWRSRCRGGRIVVSTEHDDFPALLAEALDVLESKEMDVKAASAILECTPSQLTRFLKAEPQALHRVNRERLRLGVHPLH